MIMNVDTHAPFNGNDLREYYKEVRQNGWDRYSTMLHVADYHLGRMISYIEKLDNETILLYTGDHGPREYPVMKANQIIYPGILYDSRCVRQVFGSDNMYTTSTILADLSDEPRLPFVNMTMTK